MLRLNECIVLVLLILVIDCIFVYNSQCRSMWGIFCAKIWVLKLCVYFILDNLFLSILDFTKLLNLEKKIFLCSRPDKIPHTDESIKFIFCVLPSKNLTFEFWTIF